MNAASLPIPLARTAVIALHYQNDVLDPRGKIRVGFDAD